MPKDQTNSNPNQKNDSKPEMSKPEMNRQNTRDKSKTSSKRNFSSTYQFPEIGRMVLKPSYVGKYGDIESCFLEQSASVCSHLGVSFVTPMARDKWIQEIQQLYTTITAKYTGRVEFTVQDLERYIVNVRAVRAELLDARKLYCLLNTREYNSTFFKDLRTHLSAWIVNPIVLADFYNQMRDDLLTSFPLKLEVLEQDSKLISFLYKDARVNGSTYYDFAPSPVFVNFINDAYTIEGANVLRDTAYRYNNASNTLSLFMTTVHQHIDKMTTAVNASIAAAIRATFLDDRNTEMPILHVGESIEIKYDKLVGLAISNGVCGPVTLPAIQSDGFLGWTDYTESAPHVLSYTGTSAAVKANRDAASDAAFNDCALNGIRELNAKEMLFASCLCKAVITTKPTNTSSATFYKGVGLYNLEGVSITYNELVNGVKTLRTSMLSGVRAVVSAYNTASPGFRGDPDHIATQTDCEWFPKFVAEAEVYSDAEYQNLTLFQIIDYVWDVEDYSIITGDYISKYKEYEVEYLMYTPELTRFFNIVELKNK